MARSLASNMAVHHCIAILHLLHLQRLVRSTLERMDSQASFPPRLTARQVFLAISALFKPSLPPIASALRSSSFAGVALAEVDALLFQAVVATSLKSQVAYAPNVLVLVLALLLLTKAQLLTS